MPDSLNYKDATFRSAHGTSRAPWYATRISHSDGWQAVLAANSHYYFTFDNAGPFSNISYNSVFYHLDVDDFVSFTSPIEVKPDIFAVDGSTEIEMSGSVPSGITADHGDWYHNETSQELTYIIKRQAAAEELSRKKRGGSKLYTTEDDLKVNTRIIRCFFRGCEPPPKPSELTEMPAHRELWSEAATWANFTEDGLPPSDFDNLTIPEDKYILVDVPIPRLGWLEVGMNACTYTHALTHMHMHTHTHAYTHAIHT